jgi:hypothetical protein
MQPSLSRVATLLLATALTALSATAAAGEPAIMYPAKVSTLAGRMFQLGNLDHDLGEGSFTFFDQNEEGRVAWRDLDKIVFVGNIGYGPGAEGKAQPKTRRVRLVYVDGSERIVNLVLGKVHGHDGIESRTIAPGDIAMIDFDQSRIAPSAYRVCDRGHQWEQKDYRYCPFDGQPLKEVRLDR